MMENEIEVYQGAKAEIVTKRMNYELTSPITGVSVELKRGTDFAVLPKMKSPSLLKSGAEKVIASYGLLQHYTIESKIENVTEKGAFFFYVVRCDLVRVGSDGKEYVFTSGLGSANTMEKRNGFNTPYDSANNCIKMSSKRAMVAAAINIGGLSSMFSQDMEDEAFMSGYEKIANTQDENAPVTAKQIKRLFALAEDAGLNAAEAKRKLAAAGITSTKDIKQKDYDAVCAIFTTDENNEKETK